MTINHIRRRGFLIRANPSAGLEGESRLDRIGDWEQRLRDARWQAGLPSVLGYAVQILCADTEAHLLAKHPELRGSDEADRSDATPDDPGPK